ncbi:MAG: DUF4270 family protein [Cytophagales bacterium]|nr:DUF4270 family protein [Cytophagales bacterium]
MNLLDKILKGAALSLFLIACEEPGDLGLELNPGDSETEVNFQEFVLPASTFYIDSLRTDRGTNIIVGSNTDSIYGEVTSETFLELSYESGQLPLDCLELVSARLNLQIDDKLSLEAVVNLELEIRALTDTIYGSRIYDRQDAIGVNDFVLDTWNVNVGIADSIYGLDVGRRLYGLLWQETEAAENVNDMYFGLNIKATDASDGLLALNIFADTTELIITTKDPLDTMYTTTYTFENHFNRVTRDRTGSRMAPLINTGDSISDENGYTYLNGIAGTVVRLDLDPFLDFVASQENVIINKADIEIPTVTNRANRLQSDVPDINLYFFKEETVINGPGIANDVFNTALLGENDYSNLTALPTPRVLTFSEDDSNYASTITLFTQSILTDQIAGDEFLTDDLVVIPTSGLYISQSTIQNSEVKLKVFYTIVK